MTAALLIAYAAKQTGQAVDRIANAIYSLNDELTELHRLACLSPDPVVRDLADQLTDALAGILMELEPA